ncbi:MAG: ANTAR domain-containing protein [Lachnospiraceae bacterium]|nr:ANTAR domain-containing protein [Lachnospiraceae bacterium]
MGCIIIAMPRIEDADRLAVILRGKGFFVDFTCDSAADVLRHASYDDSGVVICGYKLKDMPHMELLELLPEHYEMILTVSAARWDMCADDVLKVELPLKVGDFVRTVEMVSSRMEAGRRKGGKGPGGRTKAQQEIVEKAQRLLIERNGMERTEAYRYIQKQSMNSGNSMVEVATTILESEYDA